MAAEKKKPEAPTIDQHLVAFGKLLFVGFTVSAAGCALTVFLSASVFLCALGVASGLSIGWGIGS